MGLRERAVLHRGHGVAAYDGSALETDDDDEQTDTCGDTELEVLRHLVYQGLAELEDRENDKDDTFYENSGQRDPPGVLDALGGKLCADRIREVGVESHSRGKHDGIIGVESHDHRRKRSGNGSRGKDSLRRHSGRGQDARINCQNVRHCQESGYTGNNLGPDISAVSLQFE